DNASRFTGYFEPMIEARRIPEPGFSAPVPGPPSDIIQTPSGPVQSLPNGQTRPYPPRAEIDPEFDRILGYAHPADVFFLQIQGSGRLQFSDGTTVRAAYFAHNGQPFRSTANWLLERGKISRGEASMQGIRAWMDRVSVAEAREAMNANPRYVFFQALPEGDASLGPKGAASIPLTPLGSMAVDRDFHALGVPYLVETKAPGLGGTWRGLLVSQDTGGAIIGPVRGDIYFGTGDDAGSRAGTMNAPGRIWALLPRPAAERLRKADVAERSSQAFVLRAYLP
ncbi:MAG: MltA domain-containing protein, partial [Pseudomonadota bacterium]